MITFVFSFKEQQINCHKLQSSSSQQQQQQQQQHQNTS
jgi:hypothetical protein